MSRFREVPERTGGPDPLPLEVGLRETISELGVEGKLLEQRALLLWPGVVRSLLGEGAEGVARAERILRGELLVSVEQDVWRHRLYFELERACKALNRFVGRDVVRSIRLTGGRRGRSSTTKGS